MKTNEQILRLFALAAMSSFAMAAHATFVGDLVYCDVNANGTFDGSDYGLDDVTVTMQCTDSAGTMCFSGSTQTGPAVADTPFFNTLGNYCGDALTWDPAGDLSGRYLFEIAGACPAVNRPTACTITVDPATVPPDCNAVVTPDPAGFPVDGNMDGDYCDTEDGPFPEGQPLGNIPLWGGCDAYPDPAPGFGSYTTIIKAEQCAPHNDFGYTMAAPGTGTPGYWKNHPDAWPVDEIMIGGITYSKADAIAVIEMSVRGDKTLTMFPALVAAKLNVLIGNDASCIADTIAAADDWMAVYPVGSDVRGSSFAWYKGESLYLMLDAYNNGELCAPERD